MTVDQKTNVTEQGWLTNAQAARYCNLDRVTLYRARERGELRAGGAGRAVIQ